LDYTELLNTLDKKQMNIIYTNLGMASINSAQFFSSIDPNYIPAMIFIASCRRYDDTVTKLLKFINITCLKDDVMNNLACLLIDLFKNQGKFDPDLLAMSVISQLRQEGIIKGQPALSALIARDPNSLMYLYALGDPLLTNLMNYNKDGEVTDLL
jgi:DNA-binding NarL/FixJ family response regulator